MLWNNYNFASRSSTRYLNFARFFDYYFVITRFHSSLSYYTFSN